MEKRRSFDIVSRRARSSEALATNSKKSITDLFFKGLDEEEIKNDLIDK